MIDRYSRKELTKIWEDQNTYKIWLEIALAAAEAMEKDNKKRYLSRKRYRG